MTEHQARKIWSDVLSDAGFTIVEDPGAPELVLKVLHKTNNRVPDGIAIGYNVQLVQHVRVDRLKRNLWLPTYSDDVVTLAPKLETAEAARGGCAYFARLFVRRAHMASMND